MAMNVALRSKAWGMTASATPRPAGGQQERRLAGAPTAVIPRPKTGRPALGAYSMAEASPYRCRSSTFRTFPLTVIGNSVRISTRRGIL